MANKESQPSQDFISINEIKNDTVFLKTGGLRKVLLVSGINTELKSEAEQNALYLLFQHFVNSLDFSLQFMIHSRKLNIGEYLKYMESRQAEEINELLKSGIEEYIEFVKSFVSENSIMTKNFFVVISYDPLVILRSPGVKKYLPFLSKKANGNEEESNAEEQAAQLNQRSDQVISSLRNIGLRAVILNNNELTELFYNLYNPEPIEKKLI